MSNQTSPVVTMGDTNPPHIIRSVNGREYDLMQNEIRNDLLPKDVLRAMREWPYGLIRRRDGRWADDVFDQHGPMTYRAKPAPKVTEHVLYWEFSGNASLESFPNDTHRLTIRHTGDTLLAGTYTGPDGARIVVDALP
jgi:hypothetical protein